jgi:Asp-tRNA(Asn)/Glu-tRNA(Gln) amidotransferase A subunit family amidase
VSAQVPDRLEAPLQARGEVTPKAPQRIGEASVSQMLRELAQGRRCSVDFVEAALRAIDAREPEVRAFAHLDRGWALDQARQRDAARPSGPLHGIPLAVKDNFDTVDYPTEYNSPIYRGYRPQRDAECVARARAAGAVLLGKTVTSEFAHVNLGPTVNPVDARYSPGGSSSGSAAAVAAGFVPLALGTQTGGSAIRPASYCGVFAFKPTFGRLPVQGVKAVAPSLDTVSVFARSVEDVETCFLALAAGEEVPDSRAGKRIAIFRAQAWGSADPSTEAVLAHAAESLAAADFSITELQLPATFDRLPSACMTLLNAELARSLAREYAEDRARIGNETREAIEAGRAVTAIELGVAHELQRSCSSQLERLFDDFDAILTFSAPGEAPLGHANGDSVFNRVWTMLHVPCINLPAGFGPKRLPIGVQLVGRHRHDRQLLMLARVAGEAMGATDFVPPLRSQ